MIARDVVDEVLAGATTAAVSQGQSLRVALLLTPNEPHPKAMARVGDNGPLSSLPPTLGRSNALDDKGRPESADLCA